MSNNSNKPADHDTIFGEPALGKSIRDKRARGEKTDLEKHQEVEAEQKKLQKKQQTDEIIQIVERAGKIAAEKEAGKKVEAEENKMGFGKNDSLGEVPLLSEDRLKDQIFKSDLPQELQMLFVRSLDKARESQPRRVKPSWNCYGGHQLLFALEEVARESEPDEVKKLISWLGGNLRRIDYVVKDIPRQIKGAREEAVKRLLVYEPDIFDSDDNEELFQKKISQILEN